MACLGLVRRRKEQLLLAAYVRPFLKKRKKEKVPKRAQGAAFAVRLARRYSKLPLKREEKTGAGAAPGGDTFPFEKKTSKRRAALMRNSRRKKLSLSSAQCCRKMRLPFLTSDAVPLNTLLLFATFKKKEARRCKKAVGAKRNFRDDSRLGNGRRRREIYFSVLLSYCLLAFLRKTNLREAGAGWRRSAYLFIFSLSPPERVLLQECLLFGFGWGATN